MTAVSLVRKTADGCVVVEVAMGEEVVEIADLLLILVSLVADRVQSEVVNRIVGRKQEIGPRFEGGGHLRTTPPPPQLRPPPPPLESGPCTVLRVKRCFSKVFAVNFGSTLKISSFPES